MSGIMLYEESIIFDNDDPDFRSESDNEEQDLDSVNEKPTCRKAKPNVIRQSYSTDCLPKMSCGIMESNGFYDYPSNWLTRSESAESLEEYRYDSMICRSDLDYHDHSHDNSMTLEDLKSHFNSCKSCGVSWSDNHVSLDCLECGGYSLTRPCPLCDGKCDSEWTRDVSMSHSVGKAHWDGECHLANNNKDDLQSVPSFLAEDILIQGIEELSTSP